LEPFPELKAPQAITVEEPWGARGPSSTMGGEAWVKRLLSQLIFSQMVNPRAKQQSARGPSPGMTFKEDVFAKALESYLRAKEAMGGQAPMPFPQWWKDVVLPYYGGNFGPVSTWPPTTSSERLKGHMQKGAMDEALYGLSPFSGFRRY